MPKPRGAKKTGGRKRGTPNKFNSGIREMVIQALDEAGGVSYFKAQSELNPVAFWV
jgi:hypothetical protein